MSRELKPETVIRNLKSELKRAENERVDWRDRALKWEKLHDGRTRELNDALEEIREWKQRFDALLAKVSLPQARDIEEELHQ